MSADQVDLQSIHREFVQAFNAEKKYERENDAKFRAINQRVASYEEFRDIVKASHIQPLDRKDIVGGSRNQPWNSVSTSAKETTDGTVTAGLLKGCGLPSSTQEFIREWRRLKGNEQQQYQLLLSLSKERYYNSLMTEASSSLFGEIVVVLNKCADVSTDGQSIVNILTGLTKIPRFNLSLALLSKTEQHSIKQLFQQLSSVAPSHLQLSDLKQSYSIID